MPGQDSQIDRLSDGDAVQLTRLLRAYFEDCVAEDPGTTHPGTLKVLELLEDLETSTAQDSSERISRDVTAILDLFDRQVS